jgi:hypothetical protein
MSDRQHTDQSKLDCAYAKSHKVKNSMSQIFGIIGMLSNLSPTL